jgi:hypothetical protein
VLTCLDGIRGYISTIDVGTLSSPQFPASIELDCADVTLLFKLGRLHQPLAPDCCLNFLKVY